MFIESKELFPWIAVYSNRILEHLENLTFKKCSVIIGNTLDAQVWEVFNGLYREKDLLFKSVFWRACFDKDNILRPGWRANVAALGEFEEFNAATMVLILSFE